MKATLASQAEYVPTAAAPPTCGVAAAAASGALEASVVPTGPADWPVSSLERGVAESTDALAMALGGAPSEPAEARTVVQGAVPAAPATDVGGRRSRQASANSRGAKGKRNKERCFASQWPAAALDKVIGSTRSAAASRPVAIEGYGGACGGKSEREGATWSSFVNCSLGSFCWT